MKNILITLSLFIVLTNISAQTIKIDLPSDKTELLQSSNKNKSITLTSTLNNVIIKNTKIDNKDFFKISYNSYTKNQSIGNPNIPVLTSLIEIPLEAGVDINILNTTEEIINLNSYGINKKLEPVQHSMSKDEDKNKIRFSKNEQTYNTNSFYANDIVNVEILGIARDKRIARVTISPFKYNPVTNKLKVLYSISARITFTHPNISATNKLKAKTVSPYYNITNKLTLNSIKNTAKDVITSYPVKMVIVSDPMFKQQLQPYIQWKTQKGFNIIEAYTDNQQVGNTTTSIKTYLKNLYNSATPSDPAPSFVLFVGDVAQIPTFNGTEDIHKTDLYYCEYTNDFFPEVYYGRWSAQNTAQLQPQIDKTLEYEKYLMPDPSYLGRALLVAGVDVEGGDPDGHSSVNGNGQLQYGMNNYFNTAHGISVFEYLYPLSDDPASVQNIKDDYNTGVGYANYTAHCASSGWENPRFTTSDVPNMTNNHKFGLMVGNCCASNTFYDNECFAEAVLRKVNAGAVGYIGGSNSTYWDEDYHWGVGAQNVQSSPAVDYDATKLGAYDRVFHDNGEAEADWFVANAAIIVAGNMAVEQANDNRKNYYWEIYHLMGDPSVMNYFGVPSVLTANYEDTIVIGETYLTVNTEKYAYVALSVNNTLLDAKYTGNDTSVTINFNVFDVPDTAIIVITKQNKQPIIDTIYIVNHNFNNDVGIANIIKPKTEYHCVNISETPKIVIRNGGQANLTSCKINFSFDGGTAVNYNWTGNLLTNETDTVSFGNINLTEGTHTFKAFTSLPNGVIDEYITNDSLKINILVNNDIIIANFTVLDSTSCLAPFTVEFQNTSLNANTYTWHFGDGDTSIEKNPIHTYLNEGLYTVTLTANAGICGTDDIIKTDYININPDITCDYCDAGATGTNQYIRGFVCESINNQNTPLSPGGYADYTNMSTMMSINETYSATITGWNTSSTDKAYMWIDWNIDGDFNDENENVFAAADDGHSYYTFDINVPSNIVAGNTRMRIRWTDAGNAGTNITPCGNSNTGEVEDYTVILDDVQSINNNTNNLFNIYPNPNNGLFNIASTSNINEVIITDISGQIIYKEIFNNYVNTINLSAEKQGVYFVKVLNSTGIDTKIIIIK